MYLFTVQTSEKGQRLDHFLKTKLPYLSAKALKKRIEKGACRLNGKVLTYASHKVANKDRVEFHLSEESIPSIQILYEDDYLLVVDKPASIVSDPMLIKNHLDSRYKSCKLVHRLDKNTSGVLILAKDKKQEENLISLFRKRQVSKQYLAVIDGHMSKMEGKIETPLLVKGIIEGKKKLTPALKGMQALTHWKELSRGEDCSLIECIPITGKTHQIRVHLSSVGHPILGDTVYGKQFKCRYFAPRILLHAFSIAFKHPITQEEMQFKADIPSDFKKALEALNLEAFI